MPLTLKTPPEIAAMRRAGYVAAKVVEAMTTAARPGISTGELDQVAAALLEQAGAESASHGWGASAGSRGYPGFTCISVNEEVCHGVPGPRVLKDGDVVTFDSSVRLDGFYASRAVAIPIGSASPEALRLLQTANDALELAIREAAPGRKWSEIARLIQMHVESQGCSVVREFIGHGIGRALMEEPKVVNHVDAATMTHTFLLRPGMTITIEPLITQGRRDVCLAADGWTVYAEDGLPAAHVRHTIAVTDRGADVLTLLTNPTFTL